MVSWNSPVALVASHFLSDMQTGLDTDENVQHRIFKGSLYDMIDAQQAPYDLEFGRRTLNCLDIDVPVPPVPIPCVH